MILFATSKVIGFDEAVEGMRLSYESNDMSDSGFVENNFVIGGKDFALMKKLVNAGASHAKFARAIIVYVDIYAPIYWWKEFDTYKVGTVRLSDSTMHNLMKKPLEYDDFSLDFPDKENERVYFDIEGLNECIEAYKKTHDPAIERMLVQTLPEGYMQKSKIIMNYQVIRGMYKQRAGHKLTEWHDFRKWAEGLPYSELITL